MTTIRIPASTDELGGRLAGLDKLIVARKWERAAIVYAYTEVQVNKGSGTRPGIAPPKMNVRNFAAQCYHGLSTNKAVSRYRQAWITAISNGWAVPVEPGGEAVLPDEPFPAWPYGEGSTWEDVSTAPAATPAAHSPAAADHLPSSRPLGRPRGPNRPFTERVLDRLNAAATALRQLSVLASDDEEEPMDAEVREQVVGQLTFVRDQADAALKALQREPAPV